MGDASQISPFEAKRGSGGETHSARRPGAQSAPHNTAHSGTARTAFIGNPGCAVFLLNLREPHLLPTAPAIVRPANTPPLVVADMRSGFYNDLFFSDRFELEKLELFL